MGRFLQFVTLLAVMAVSSAAASDLEVPPRYEVFLSSCNASEAVQEIRKQTGLVISFELEALDPATQGIRAAHRRDALIQKEKSSDLSEQEKTLLESARKVAEEYPDAIVGWDTPRETGTVTADTPEKLLAEFCRMYPVYEFEGKDGRYNVFPRKSALDFEMAAMSIKDQTLAEVIRDISPQLAEHQIFHVSVMIGIPKPDLKVTWLELPSLPAREFFTRLAQAVGPDVYWFVGGMKGSRLVDWSCPSAVSGAVLVP